MNINKLLHGPNVAGQSLVDRVMAAKHSLTGEGLAKTVCKATTEEIGPPKKKHIDCKYCDSYIALLSPVHTVAEQWDCRRKRRDNGEIRRLSHFSATVWTGF